jgi:hypothetical protein
MLGYIARRSANVGKGHEVFRFTKETFMALINQLCLKLNRRIVIVQEFKKDLITELVKNGTD